MDRLYVGTFHCVKLDAHALPPKDVNNHSLRLDRVAGGEVELDDNLGARLEGIVRDAPVGPGATSVR